MEKSYTFTSESVSEGHPDKICDAISDAILDATLSKDPNARVACETLTTTNFVINAGEVRLKDWKDINPEQIARDTVAKIGYTKDEYLFSASDFEYENRLHEQSADISMGVDRESELGAGDQGMMFGYATNETKEMMPAPIMLAHRIIGYFTDLRKKNEITFLRPDAKAQVSVEYEKGLAKRVDTIILSHQTDEIDPQKIQKTLKNYLRDFFTNTNLIDHRTNYHINPTGKFVIGGPHGDAGLTGRKIIVDTYGGAAPHGGGAFSGKDPSKVDRSAAYFARYVAKNLVAAGIADRCLIQVSYAIGVAKPVSIFVSTFGTGKIADEVLSKWLLEGKFFDFRPATIIESLELNQPKNWSYRETSSLGHFGKNHFPWEMMDRKDEIIDLFNLKK